MLCSTLMLLGGKVCVANLFWVRKKFQFLSDIDYGNVKVAVEP